MTKWTYFTLADAFKPRPPLEYAVEGLFPLPSLSIVYGSPGTLKSLLLTDMAICVASGTPWLLPVPQSEGKAFDVSQYPTLWIDLDNGRQRTDERIEALGRAYDLPETVPFYYVSMPSPWLDATKSDSVENLTSLIQEKNVRLVIIDNLGVIRGKADENSAEMANIMSALRNLSENLRIAIVLIHHQRKSSNIAGGRAGDALRGHSSIEAAIDLALLVERDEGSALAVMKSTKTRGVDVPPFGAQFDFTHKPDSVELSTACFYGWEVEDVMSDHIVQQTIIETVAQRHSINKGGLTNMVKKALPKVSTTRIRSVINRLYIAHQLVMTTGTDNSKLYSIATDSGDVTQVDILLGQMGAK